MPDVPAQILPLADMSPVVIAPIVIVIAVLASVAIWYGWQQEKKRTEALRAFAQRLGLSFSPGRDHTHDEIYDHFEIFRRGFDRAAFNTMRGAFTKDDRRFECNLGDFRFKRREGSGKNRRTVTHRFSYCIVHLPFAALPDLLIRREGMFDKIAGVFGHDDIDFESSEFSRKFFVKSPDKKFAYDVCHPRMIEYLLASSPPTVDIEFGRCCLSDGHTRWNAEAFETTLGWFGGFVERWPEFLIKELDARAAYRAGGS